MAYVRTKNESKFEIRKAKQSQVLGSLYGKLCLTFWANNIVWTLGIWLTSEDMCSSHLESTHERISP